MALSLIFMCQRERKAQTTESRKGKGNPVRAIRIGHRSLNGEYTQAQLFRTSQNNSPFVSPSALGERTRKRGLVS